MTHYFQEWSRNYCEYSWDCDESRLHNLIDYQGNHRSSGWATGTSGTIIIRNIFMQTTEAYNVTMTVVTDVGCVQSRLDRNIFSAKKGLKNPMPYHLIETALTILQEGWDQTLNATNSTSQNIIPSDTTGCECGPLEFFRLSALRIKFGDRCECKLVLQL